MRPEIRARIYSARQALHSIGPKILAAGPISKNHKLYLADALIDSRAFLYAQIWHASASKHLAELDAPRIEGWRRVLCLHNADKEAPRTTNVQVMAAAKRPTARDVVFICRLRYIKRFIQKAPLELKALVQTAGVADDTWAGLINADVKRAQTYALPDHPIAALPDPATDPRAWVNYFVTGAYGWVPLIKRIWHRCVDDACSAADLPPPPPDARCRPGREGDGIEHKCPECTAAFSSAQRLSVHRQGVHGVLSPLRLFVFHPTCLVCNVHFWTADRCFHHLARSVCGGVVSTSECTPLSPEAARARVAQGRATARANLAKGLGRRYAERPPVQASGPLHPLFPCNLGEVH